MNKIYINPTVETTLFDHNRNDRPVLICYKDDEEILYILLLYISVVLYDKLLIFIGSF